MISPGLRTTGGSCIVGLTSSKGKTDFINGGGLRLFAAGIFVESGISADSAADAADAAAADAVNADADAADADTEAADSAADSAADATADAADVVWPNSNEPGSVEAAEAEVRINLSFFKFKRPVEGSTYLMGVKAELPVAGAAAWRVSPSDEWVRTWRTVNMGI